MEKAIGIMNTSHMKKIQSKFNENADLYKDRSFNFILGETLSGINGCEIYLRHYNLVSKVLSTSFEQKLDKNKGKTLEGIKTQILLDKERFTKKPKNIQKEKDTLSK